MRKKGFTLAEILIVLGIIGVIAELTIPTLVASYQKQQFVTSLKKAYSEFNQALVQVASNSGCAGDLRCVDAATSGATFANQFKTLKVCGSTPSQGCMSDSVNTFYDSTGGMINLDVYGVFGFYSFTTVDGMSFSVHFFDCGDSIYTGNMSKLCGDVYVDVNGPKNSPNAFGRDVYWFFITNGKGPLLYPAGGQEESDSRWTDASGNPQACYTGYKEGLYCAARIMEEEWQMNY